MAAPAIQVNGLEELAVTIRVLPKELKDASDLALRRGGALVEKFWKIRLSGPAGSRRLGVGTGRLRQSIKTSRVHNGSVRVGTDVPYAAVHEFGFRGGVTVRAHFRRGGIPVRSHRRQMNIPQRPHRAPALRDSSKPIELLFAGQVEKAIAEARRRGKAVRSSLPNFGGLSGPHIGRRTF